MKYLVFLVYNVFDIRKSFGKKQSGGFSITQYLFLIENDKNYHNYPYRITCSAKSER